MGWLGNFVRKGYFKYMVTRNDLCWCGSGKKYKKCHMAYDERLNEMRFDPMKGQCRPPHKVINNPRDIEGIKRAAAVNIGLLDLMSSMVREGIDTARLDKAAHDYTVDHGGIPACLGYEGFPKSVCISLNNVVCHGIPSRQTIVKEGDILNIDATTIVDGYYADASRMFMVGEVSPAAKRLVEKTFEIMQRGIQAAQPWHFIGDVGYACNALAEECGYSVVTALGGHGVGKGFHLDPYVAHKAEKHTGMLMVPGMVFTVEPMINQGKFDVVVDKKDGWTVRTKDGSLSAQWEKTILITETGNEVLAY